MIAPSGIRGGIAFDAGPGPGVNDPAGAGGAVGFRDASAEDVVAPDAAPSDLLVVPGNPPPVPGYLGRPWNNTPQVIPGAIQCAHFDLGGEGVAYHDTDMIDEGIALGGGPAGGLRPGEGVDVGFALPSLDHSITPTPIQPGQSYVGWTHPGEWVRYTLTVSLAGRYFISAMMSASADGSLVSFSFEDGATTGPRPLPSTKDVHIWQGVPAIGFVDLTAGTHVLTVKFEAVATDSLAFLAFARQP